MIKNYEDLSLEEIRDIISKSIETGKGLISYRKHLSIIKSLMNKEELLFNYRQSLVEDIDKDLNQIASNIAELREKIKSAVETDNSIPSNETGGKTMKLPDIATVSLGKEIERIIFEDPLKTLDALGKKFQKQVITLDKVKAKDYIISSNKEIPGVKKEKGRVLSITFKK